ncbi:dUTP diphosphatase [Alkalicoccus daliensis]|uniref:Dimeric dUTPase, all-alpha-NTP-PPase (MazG) superfamily n=1 Tax=Alkalicoccus daliensis TaxID=745820 RepID=A0A1H0CFA4_9BACI|nr:dUTP diphosphatase [Alkalicoccus daliensis]SDN56503.1 Dimeric dUTPase, all-alpha-NTP-PPase (MazG) superfamily [Alkalicoccus daliensis]
MQLQELFEKQQQLDTYIENKRGIENNEVFEEKLLAFMVEAGELANEVRSFKFWSSKAPSEKEIILEEYVDGLHFLASIGNTLEVQPQSDSVDTEVQEASKKEITSAFLEIFGTVSLLRIEPSPAVFGSLFSAYIELAGLLGYSWEEVTAAYQEKNKENYSRQENGY